MRGNVEERLRRAPDMRLKASRYDALMFGPARWLPPAQRPHDNDDAGQGLQYQANCRRDAHQSDRPSCRASAYSLSVTSRHVK